MTNTTKAIGVFIAGLAIGLLVSVVNKAPTPTYTPTVGGVYNQVQQVFDQAGFHVGPNGTAVNGIQFGTCNLTQMSVGSFAASSTGVFFCAVTGVLAGDNIHVDMPAGAGVNTGSAGSISGGFIEVAGYATTTGILAVEIANGTGAATSSFVQATTSVEYLIHR